MTRMEIAEEIAGATPWSPDTAWSVLRAANDDRALAERALNQASRTMSDPHVELAAIMAESVKL